MPYATRGRGQGKAAAWCGRLLLFAALIVGIVGMHTLGHPVGGHGSGATAAAHQEHAQPMPDPHRRHAAPEHTAREHTARQHADQEHAARQHTVRASSLADDHHAMNPGAVCLAVLTLWVLVLVRAGRLLGRRAADLLAAVRARLLRGLRPIPPPVPRHKHLARLSVLRV
ncbi:hypothetical protein CP973_10210 [Streptomyces albofaciens JCM 4342]|uniref:hypothetical protein n=1 Tax=Streptomyces albofaciens TaxID=66866 RepID=UPI001238FA39|nr:hypothetical protein [Streptomyces albofaciens]KAA6222271.1 hypothetical protein CP973_10210 [Streptomyces albofaciens JCM 4342]